jgi:galactose-1-phosphate uridylyltransferase
MEHTACDFCRKFAQPSAAAQWYDRELVTAGQVALVPALGALATGSVLVLTRQHYLSMRAVPRPTLDTVLELTEAACSHLSERVGPTIVFEHGAGSDGGGGCITHAHFQIMPMPLEINDIVSTRLSQVAADRIPTLRQFSDVTRENESYLLLMEPSGTTTVFHVSNLHAQFMRRVIATLLGEPDAWDYLAYPNYDRIKTTISLFDDFTFPGGMT